MRFLWKKKQQLGGPPTSLDVPRRYQGELLGHANELAEEYAILGFGKGMVRYVDEDEFVLR